mmetsp:Transcript_24097/g.44373  ORF Transcript_24097/g.44373 Transcript_24097/m.44373 type:complete len:223 (-) Transcript_24097:693-1361(-)
MIRRAGSHFGGNYKSSLCIVCRLPTTARGARGRKVSIWHSYRSLTMSISLSFWNRIFNESSLISAPDGSRKSFSCCSFSAMSMNLAFDTSSELRNAQRMKTVQSIWSGLKLFFCASSCSLKRSRIQRKKPSGHGSNAPRSGHGGPDADAPDVPDADALIAGVPCLDSCEASPPLSEEWTASEPPSGNIPSAGEQNGDRLSQTTRCSIRTQHSTTSGSLALKS